jgi:AcrR family transcriptional regulator
MATGLEPSFKPRKQPVQARSEATVSALCQASIQVLLAVGYRRLTTTRVAERAGVSVGTLYQYFPNREALIASVIERYLEGINASVAQDCRALSGRPLGEVASGLVDAFIAAKWERIDVSRALHEPLGDIRGARIVAAAAAKAAGVVAAILENCPDASFHDVQTSARFVVLACSSLLQAAVADHTNSLDPERLRVHMRSMALGYLRETRRLQETAKVVPPR